MSYPPLDPAGARILVTNDDGINAAGLEALSEIARALSDDVWIVAPEMNQSGIGHALSLSHPLRLREIGERRFAIQGTPTDCVLFATQHLLKDKPPVLVLSGVNHGANIADDVTYSGTIAGAMEGCLLGIRSIALSQAYTRGEPVKWATAVKHGPAVVRTVLSIEWPKEAFVNVNFPNVVADSVAGVEVTRQGHLGFGGFIDERDDLRGGKYYWVGYAPEDPDPPKGTDAAALRQARISVTPLHLDLTHETMRRRLSDALAPR
ncbi:MAG: 5'/3'-nucleotidase SurE [Alphaproteobacteria bacterium]|nr:5'/3'-nucleotidase SurE [Alphaproteobacteria bacterium]